MNKESLTPLQHSSQNRCFGCGLANSVGLHLDFYVSEDRTAVAFPTVPDTYEGPAGFVHGGIIATLLDEAMSKAVRVQGFTSVTRQIEVEYLRPVPSVTPIRVEGRVVRSEGRKHWTEAKVMNERSSVLATAKGLFIEVHASHLTRGRSGNRPEVD